MHEQRVPVEAQGKEGGGVPPEKEREVAPSVLL